MTRDVDRMVAVLRAAKTTHDRPRHQSFREDDFPDPTPEPPRPPARPYRRGDVHPLMGWTEEHGYGPVNRDWLDEETS